MPRKKKPPLSFVESLARITRAGLKKEYHTNLSQETWDTLSSVDERVTMIMGLVNNPHRKNTDMLFFVMYDIESDKVRRMVVKYLEKEGCTRVQKSIFLASLPTSQYEQIRNDLAEVQACYENNDSILIVPISTDYLNAMKIIGQSINIDVITKTKSTLFF